MKKRTSNETMTGPGACRVRRATRRDLGRMGQLAGALVRQHHAYDPQRFLLVDEVERGYAWWFGRELKNAQAVLLVAECGEEIAGYAYGRIEERDWNALLDAYGAFHDLYVDDRFRRRGIGELLVRRMLQELEDKGAPRVVLHTATANESAHRLFASVGFRRTMLEMTREAGGDSSDGPK